MKRKRGKSKVGTEGELLDDLLSSTSTVADCSVDESRHTDEVSVLQKGSGSK
jgi:hypothetical protein